MLRAPNRPCAISHSRSTRASKMKSLSGDPNRRQHLDKMSVSRQKGRSVFCSLYNIISELVQKEWRCIRPQILGDQCDFLRCTDAFNDLLCSPCPILVDANHSEMGSDPLQHRKPGARGALLEQLLHNLHCGMLVSDAGFSTTRCP